MNEDAFFYQLASKPDDFSRRQWQLPEGFETKANEESPSPLNSNRLGSALKDVIIKWSENDSGGTVKTTRKGDLDSSLGLHLVKILVGCVRVMPDSQVRQAFEVIKPDLLVVLSRSPCDRFRAAIVRLLHALLERSEEEQLNFLKSNGLILLANQLENYATTPCVTEACISLCIGVDIVLEQANDLFSMWPESPSNFQIASTVLLLALLPNSALDPALFHQIVTLVRAIVTRSGQMLRVLLDLGLVEAIAKSVVALAHAAKRSGDVLEQREDEILLDGVHRLLLFVSNRLISASGDYLFCFFFIGRA